MTYYPEADPVQRAEKILAVGQGSAGRYMYQVFNVAGTIEIVGLYATLTTVTDATTLGDLAFDVGKEADTAGGTWLTAGAGPTGAAMGGFSEGSWIGKCDAAASVADVLDATDFALNEKPLDAGDTFVVKEGELSATTIGLQVTEDNDTDVEFHVVFLWKPRSPGASVTAGSGATRSAV